MTGRIPAAAITRAGRIMWASSRREARRTGNLVDVCDSVKASDGSTWYYVRIAGSIYGFVCGEYIERL